MPVRLPVASAERAAHLRAMAVAMVVLVAPVVVTRAEALPVTQATAATVLLTTGTVPAATEAAAEALEWV